MLIDERAHKRREVSSYLKATYRDTGIELGRVADLCEGGMRLCGVRPIQTSRTLTLKLNSSAGTINLNDTIFRVEVVWCARARNEGLYYTGVRFLENDPLKSEIIRDLMRKETDDDRWSLILKDLEY